MILVYDTETTGYPLKKQSGVVRPPPSDHPDQPHLVELALLLYEEDGTEVKAWCKIVRPDGWEIPADVAALHGITTERALAEGVPLRDVVEKYIEAVNGRSRLRVCHNPYFDEKIMRTAMLRAGFDRAYCDALRAAKPTFDTCRAATKLVALPPTEAMKKTNFRNSYKAPNLAECYKHFFDSEIENAHSALADARATARLYFHLLNTEAEPPKARPLGDIHGDSSA